MLCFLLTSCFYHATKEGDKKSELIHWTGNETWIEGPSSSPSSPADVFKEFKLQNN